MRITLDTERDEITIDDVVISLDVLRTLANPDPEWFYRFRRDENVVTVERFELQQT